MRLDIQELEAITSSIKELDPNADIYLFGSRTDDAKKGGDIDILIISSLLNNGDKLFLKGRIFEKIEEQKIDILIAQDTSDPFIRLALKTGIKL